MVLLFPMFSVAGQENSLAKPMKLGVSYSAFGRNDVVQFDVLDGGAGYQGDKFLTVGATWIIRFKPWLEAETGLDFSRHSFLILPNLPPDFDASPRKSDITMLVVPLSVRINLLRYFFLNGGILLNMDMTPNSQISSQTGIGIMLGAGLRYEFSSGFQFFLNPYGRMHALIPFSGSRYPQRSVEEGIRIGMAFTLKNNQ